MNGNILRDHRLVADNRPVANGDYLHHDDLTAYHLGSKAFSFTCFASSSFGGEHTICINGNACDPSLTDVFAVVDKLDIGKERTKRAAQHVQKTVKEELGDIRRFECR